MRNWNGWAQQDVLYLFTSRVTRFKLHRVEKNAGQDNSVRVEDLITAVSNLLVKFYRCSIHDPLQVFDDRLWLCRGSNGERTKTHREANSIRRWPLSRDK